MAFSLVGHVGVGLGANGGTTGAQDTSTANFLALYYSGAGTGPSVSDSKFNTWLSCTASSGGGLTGQIYYVEGALTGTGHTFTVTNIGAFLGVAIAWFSGGAASSSFDVEAINYNSSGPTFAPGNITPTQAGDLILAGWSYNNATTYVSVDSGMTLLDAFPTTGGSNIAAGMVYAIQTSAAAINPTITVGSSVAGPTAIAAFKVGAAGPTFIPAPRRPILQAVNRASTY